MNLGIYFVNGEFLMKITIFKENWSNGLELRFIILSYSLWRIMTIGE